MTSQDFSKIFNELKRLLTPYVENMQIVTDSDLEYYLNTSFIMSNKKPLFFAAIKINKNYVSYHLMPVYVAPELLEDLSPNLKKRMQGKSCFNFKVSDQTLITELTRLTNRGYQSYVEQGYL